MAELDRNLFQFLNSLNTPFLDSVMWFFSLKTAWIPLYIFIIYLLAVRYGKRIWLILLYTLLLVVITDQVSLFMKNHFGRLRPCHDPSLQGLVHTLNGYCGGMYGFVSGHTSNSFGLAAFTTPLVKRKWFTWSIFAWATLVSYSRIYLGVHYPGDVAGGIMLGLLAGSGMAIALKETDKRIGLWK